MDLPKYLHSFFVHFVTYSLEYAPTVSMNITTSFGVTPQLMTKRRTEAVQIVESMRITVVE